MIFLGGNFFIFLANSSIIKYGQCHLDVFQFFQTKETIGKTKGYAIKLFKIIHGAQALNHHTY